MRLRAQGPRPHLHVGSKGIDMLNDLYHMLDPVAISAGPITIYWYGLAYVVGALLTAVVMYRTQRRWVSTSRSMT